MPKYKVLQIDIEKDEFIVAYELRPGVFEEINIGVPNNPGDIDSHILPSFPLARLKRRANVEDKPLAAKQAILTLEGLEEEVTEDEILSHQGAPITPGPP